MFDLLLFFVIYHGYYVSLFLNLLALVVFHFYFFNFVCVCARELGVERISTGQRTTVPFSMPRGPCPRARQQRTPPSSGLTAIFCRREDQHLEHSRAEAFAARPLNHRSSEEFRRQSLGAERLEEQWAAHHALNDRFCGTAS